MNGNMKNLDSVVGSIIAAAIQNQPKDESDYINPDDGLLYCGKCKTRKQYRVELPARDGEEKISHKVPVSCECRKKEMEIEKNIEQKRKNIELVHSLRDKSLMDDKFRYQTFENFQTTKENEKTLKLCRRYVDNFDDMVEKNQGLLFWGDVGTGKSFSAACIANALLDKRIPVVMTSFVKLLEKIQCLNDDEEKILDKLNKAKLLIIDDLGAERNTDFALEKVYNIIDSRYRAKLPIILTTNLNLEDMKRASDIRYSRVYDRIFEICYPVKFIGPSFRKIEANRRFKEMKNFLEG